MAVKYQALASQVEKLAFRRETIMTIKIDVGAGPDKTLAEVHYLEGVQHGHKVRHKYSTRQIEDFAKLTAGKKDMYTKGFVEGLRDNEPYTP
jgi:hypothetical protein